MYKHNEIYLEHGNWGVDFSKHRPIETLSRCTLTETVFWFRAEELRFIDGTLCLVKRSGCH